jgi:hypothetical protein
MTFPLPVEMVVVPESIFIPYPYVPLAPLRPVKTILLFPVEVMLPPLISIPLPA